MRAARFQQALGKLNRQIPRAISAVLGFLAFIMLLQTAAHPQIGGGWPAAVFVVAAMPGLWLPAIVIHELGHATAAQLVGWRIWVFRVGPLTLKFRPKLSLSLGRLFESGDIGGAVCAVPKFAPVNTRWRAIVMTLGGPIASLAGAATYFVALGPPSDDSLWRGLLAAFSASSLACAVLTLWPFTEADGRGNDAHKVLVYLRAQSFPGHPTTYASSLVSRGFAVRDFDPWLKEAAERVAKIEGTLSDRFLETVAHSPKLVDAELENFGAEYAQTPRAYLDAYMRDDTAAAEARLISPGSGAFSPTWRVGRRLRELTLIAILASANERDDAEARLWRLEEETAADAPRNPHWIALIEQARARVARVSTPLEA